MRTWAMLLFLVMLKNFNVCTVILWELHALFSEGVYTPLIGPNKVACAPGVV